MPTSPKLTQRDFDIIQTAGRFKFLTTFQLQKVFFPNTTHHSTASNRLTALTNSDFLSRTFSYPRAEKGKLGRPTAVYFWGASNQKNLQTYFEKNGEASKWEEFKNLPPNSREEFSQLYLSHETGISEIFLVFEQATPTENYDLTFWERTSPFSREIGEHLSVDIQKGDRWFSQKNYFNPDAFFCTKKADAYNLFFLEFDNNTAQALKFRKKLEVYQAYNRQRKFPELLQRYAKKYLLPISNPERAGFRVLTVAPDERRRDQLLLEAVKLKAFKMFWFASLTDIKPQTILSPIWLRGKEFDSISQEYKEVEKNLSPLLKSRWLSEKIKDMPRVSLTD